MHSSFLYTFVGLSGNHYAYCIVASSIIHFDRRCVTDGTIVQYPDGKTAIIPKGEPIPTAAAQQADNKSVQSDTEANTSTEANTGTQTDTQSEEPSVPVDSQGKPLPMRINKKGEQDVDEKTLWNNSPEEWCIFNDKKSAKDKVMTSDEMLESAVKALDKQLKDLQKQMRKAQETMDMDVLDGLKDENRSLNERKARLNAIQTSRAEAAKKAEIEAQRAAEEAKKAEEAAKAAEASKTEDVNAEEEAANVEEVKVDEEVAAEAQIPTEQADETATPVEQTNEAAVAESAEQGGNTEEQAADAVSSDAGNGAVEANSEATNADAQTAEAETAQAENNEDDSVDVGDTTPTLSNVIRILYNYGRKAASKLFQRAYFDVAKTPDFMKGLGITGSKFTIKYGVIARHSTKDAQHALSPEIWDKLPEALQNPFAITKYFADADKKKQKGYRIYTSLQLKDGSYIVVGAEVRNAGRDLEVNSIDTVFGKRDNSGLGEKEEEIYRSKEITPEQSSLLERPNSAQYPTEQELSADKVTESSGKTNTSEEKTEENAAPKHGSFI